MSDTKKPDKGDPGKGGGQTVLERKSKTKKPRMFRVLLHNDDYTTMEFVVWVLERVFHKSDTEANALMLSIHHKGYGVAGVFTKDIAETKVAQTLALANENGMPLLCTLEPDD